MGTATSWTSDPWCFPSADRFDRTRSMNVFLVAVGLIGVAATVVLAVLSVVSRPERVEQHPLIHEPPSNVRSMGGVAVPPEWVEPQDRPDVS